MKSEKQTIMQFEEKTFWTKLKKRFAQNLTPESAPASQTGRLNVGIVGTGNVVKWKYLPALQSLQSKFALQKIYDVNPQAMEAIHQQTGAKICFSDEDLLEDPSLEAVFICTPPSYHFEFVQKALKNGKHILCEKPLALTSQEALSLYEMSKSKPKIHMVNFIKRFQPEWRVVHEIIHQGVLGEIYTFWGTYAQGGWIDVTNTTASRPDKAAWRQQPGGGVLHEIGSHFLDLFSWNLGEVKDVQAWLSPAAKTTSLTDELSGVSLTFASGCKGIVEFSRVATGYRERSFLEIYGSKGSLRFDQDNVFLWTQSDPRWKPILLSKVRPFEFLEQFYQAVKTKNTDAIPTFYDGLVNNQILDSIFLSCASNGCRVPVTLSSK